MKPERINVAPWINEWDSAAPFLHKKFNCRSFSDATHTANHVHRVAVGYGESEIDTSIDNDNVVTVKILPKETELISDGQYALAQRIDEALYYLMEEVDSGDEAGVNPDVLN